MKEDLIKNNSQIIEDDILTFFFAGALTIQASTSNLIMYSINLPEVKSKILAEVDTLMDLCKDDVRNKLTVEVAEEHLIYTRYAYMESLRIEPPASLTTIQTFNRDVTFESGVKSKLPKFTLKKGEAFMIAIEEIQKDPKQWHEPDSFIPERFDEKSPYYLRPNGEPRHPLAYSPFLGGKRICLGKTFAEITTRLTVPILMHSLNFEYVEKAHYESKPKYTIGMMGIKKIMLKVTKRNNAPKY